MLCFGFINTLVKFVQIEIHNFIVHFGVIILFKENINFVVALACWKIIECCIGVYGVF